MYSCVSCLSHFLWRVNSCSTFRGTAMVMITTVTVVLSFFPNHGWLASGDNYGCSCSLGTAKLKGVIQSGCDAFACQTRQDTVKKQFGNSFDKWLKPQQIGLEPLLWGVCCDVYTRFKVTYEAANDDKACFGVHRFGFVKWGLSWRSAQWIFLRDKELYLHSAHKRTHTQTYKSPGVSVPLSVALERHPWNMFKHSR